MRNCIIVTAPEAAPVREEDATPSLQNTVMLLYIPWQSPPLATSR
jgi:hypothetical protein